MRALLGATATINVFSFATSALLVLYAMRTLGLAPGELGLVLGVGGAFTLSCVLFPAPAILLPVAAGMSKPVILALLFAAEFGSGVGVVMLDITIGAILTATVPDVLRA